MPRGSTIVLGAFQGSGLTSVTIPATVTSIEDFAFSECAKLTSITLTEGLATIGYGAFQNSGLTSISIPASVTTIQQEAFSGCAKLGAVTCLATTPPALGVQVFTGIKPAATLKVPAASVDAYKANAKWKEYFDSDNNISAIE